LKLNVLTLKAPKSLHKFSFFLYILVRSSRENLFKYQDNSSLVINYLILMTCTCYVQNYVLIWWGEIWYWSLLGLKGLSFVPLVFPCVDWWLWKCNHWRRLEIHSLWINVWFQNYPHLPHEGFFGLTTPPHLNPPEIPI